MPNMLSIAAEHCPAARQPRQRVNPPQSIPRRPHHPRARLLPRRRRPPRGARTVPHSSVRVLSDPYYIPSYSYRTSSSADDGWMADTARGSSAHQCYAAAARASQPGSSSRQA